MNAPRIKLLTLAAGAALVAAVSGCDPTENANLDNGRVAFNEQCGTCHAMAEAGTSAEIGPDLDAAFAAARAAGGFDSDTIEGIVEYQISNPRQTDPKDPAFMPANLVTGDEKRDVAAYVASVAGVPGIEPPAVDGGPGAQIFASNGCGACHILNALGDSAQGAVGPDLDQALPEQTPEEILMSIVNPSAEVINGFPDGVMPGNYGQSISKKDLQVLADYLAEVAGDDRGAPNGNTNGRPAN